MTNGFNFKKFPELFQSTEFHLVKNAIIKCTKSIFYFILLIYLFISSSSSSSSSGGGGGSSSSSSIGLSGVQFRE